VKSQVIEKNETGCGPDTGEFIFGLASDIRAPQCQEKTEFYILLEHLPSLAALKSVCSTPAAHRFRVCRKFGERGSKKPICGVHVREEPSFGCCAAAVQSISLNMQSKIMECACLMITIAQN
jgi:hypothetical protein